MFHCHYHLMIVVVIAVENNEMPGQYSWIVWIVNFHRLKIYELPGKKHLKKILITRKKNIHKNLLKWFKHQRHRRRRLGSNFFLYTKNQLINNNERKISIPFNCFLAKNNECQTNWKIFFFFVVEAIIIRLENIIRLKVFIANSI